MADGCIRIDTKLDDSGLLEGLQSLEHSIGQALQSAGAQAALFTQAAWADMTEGIGAACAALWQSVAQGIAEEEAPVQAAMESLAGKLRDGISGDNTEPYDNTKQAVAGATQAATEALAPFAASMEALGEGGDTAFSDALAEDKGRATAGAYIQAAQGGVETTAPGLVSAAGQTAQETEGAAGSVLTYDAGSSIGQNFGQGMASGISGTAGSIAEAARNAAQGAYDAAMAALDIHSPSRVMRWVGEMFGEGFAEGIDDSAGLAEREAEALANTALDAMAAKLELDFDAAALVERAQAALDGERLTLYADVAYRAGVTTAGAGEEGAAGGGVTVHIESLSVHTDQMNDEQDWQEAGRALAEEFARQARYRGVVVSGG